MNNVTQSTIDFVHQEKLSYIENKILQNQVKIEAWFRKQWQSIQPPIYSSVDLRNSGYKMAPIDTNLFPAGFNNLGSLALPIAVQAIQFAFEKLFPGCLRILIVPENHTRNLHYLESLRTLKDILDKAGFETRIGSLIEELNENMEITLPSGSTVLLEPLTRKENRVGVKNFDACVVLLNHDLSSGIPEILQNLEQKIVPHPYLGWSHRLKSQHFQHYNEVTRLFSQLIDLDPWLINPLFSECQDVNIVTGEGEQALYNEAYSLYQKIEEKYQFYQLKNKPYLVIKADAGTYGMGVLTIKHPDELKELNRKERTKMAVSKGGKKIRRVLIQEGIPTYETYGSEQATAEPVVYMIGSQVVGGFYRIHQEKSVDENLNSPGMYFEPIAFGAPCNCPELQKLESCQVNRLYTYGVIARLAALAAGYEYQELLK